MNRQPAKPAQNPAQNDELSHASYALAQFFDGIVIEDVDLDWQPVASPEQGRSPASPPAPMPPIAASAAATAPFMQDEQWRVSLNQLRQWYAIARALGRSDRLLRIAQLGSQFKQMFGEAEPDLPRPFSAWSAREIEWWLADIAAYHKLA